MSPRRRRDADGPAILPLPPGPIGNGEFIPAAPCAIDHEVERVIRDLVDTSARRAGIDRRRFLLTAGGVAASLAAFNLAACSGRRGRAASAASTTGPPPTTGPSSTTGPPPTTGGTFTVPPPVEQAACADALGGSGEFIFDVHTHHVMPQGPWRHDAPRPVGLVEGMLPAGCTQADPLDCVDRAAYLHDLFLSSDTTVAMLTDVPNSGPGRRADPVRRRPRHPSTPPPGSPVRAHRACSSRTSSPPTSGRSAPGSTT